MGFNSAFKRVKIVKTPGNGRLNNLNDPVLNVLRPAHEHLSLNVLRKGTRIGVTEGEPHTKPSLTDNFSDTSVVPVV